MCLSDDDPGGPRRCPGDCHVRLVAAEADVDRLDAEVQRLSAALTAVGEDAETGGGRFPMGTESPYRSSGSFGDFTASVKHVFLVMAGRQKPTPKMATRVAACAYEYDLRCGYLNLAAVDPRSAADAYARLAAHVRGVDRARLLCFAGHAYHCAGSLDAALAAYRAADAATNRPPSMLANSVSETGQQPATQRRARSPSGTR